MRHWRRACGIILAVAALLPQAVSQQPAISGRPFDVVILHGKIIDGSGNPWYHGDIGIRGDRIAAIGNLDGATANRTIDARGLVVAPGFIDMLGQSETALLIDNRAVSKLSQGITTEITGEGGSIAPQNEKTLKALAPSLEPYHLKVDWTDLAGYFKRLERQGTPLNLGTYVGAAQVREAVLGDNNRQPSPRELDQMRALVAQAMQQGALGISTALIYPPGHYAKTDELIELAKVAARYGGIYATHMRSEGRSESAAIEEALRIGREANIPVEIFHLKVVGQSRWGSMPKVIARLESARSAGLDVTADMYPYLAGATALASALPPWAADGGLDKLLERLHDPAIRARIKREMAQEHPDWENLYLGSGGAAGVMLSSVINKELKPLTGKTLAQITQDPALVRLIEAQKLAQEQRPAAASQGQPARASAALDSKPAATANDQLDTIFDLILADRGQSGALYFIASEADLEYGLKQPWTSIGLDANEMPLDGLLFEPHTHPRAFGSMPRFLGYYVREQHLLPLEQAIRKITSLPAQRVHLAGRGLLREGFYADITIFDPDKIFDKATYSEPARLSQGVQYVLVNGELTFADGKLTGANPGRALRGPGAR